MNSGCSLSSGSAGQTLEALTSSSCHQWSRPGDQLMSRPGPAIDDDVLEGGAFGGGAVGVLLERDDLAAAIAAVGGDQHLGLAVLDPPGEGLGAEAAEDDRVRGADPGTGQRRDDQLGDHRHVDRHDVALLDAQALEHVGELADLAEQVLVAEHPALAGLALPDQGGLVLARARRSAGRGSCTRR